MNTRIFKIRKLLQLTTTGLKKNHMFVLVGAKKNMHSH